MKSAMIALLLVALSFAPARSAPGDPKLAEGTLVWPPTLRAEPVLILRGDDGRIFYADVASARRQTTTPIRAGMRLAFVGVEGGHPGLIRATAFGPGDAAALTLAVATAPPRTVAPSPATVAPASPTRWSEVRGVVRAVDAGSLTLETSDGERVTVDVSGLRELPATVKPGAVVGVFGVPVETELRAMRVAEGARRR